MKITFISAEKTPIAKVGGLADVITGLSREMRRHNHHLEIILPRYSHLDTTHIDGLEIYLHELMVPWFSGLVPCQIWKGTVWGQPCYFIDPNQALNYFTRGRTYGESDDDLRFTFFSKASLEFIHQSGKTPDILHCHDWQTALVPVLLYELYQHKGFTRTRVCLTIHNFKHQGITNEQVLIGTGLNRTDYFFNTDRLLDNYNPQVLNLLKGGIVYSNFITTVSPKHAWEAKEEDQGFGLKPTLRLYHMKYGGVLNGLDYEYWNPNKDPLIPHHYTAATVEQKSKNKRYLQQKCSLSPSNQPLVAFIGRLDPQKGLDLIQYAIPRILELGAQCILLGNSHDPAINREFEQLKKGFVGNQNCHLELNFDEALAHLIYAGSDFMLVPSRFEPCGLTQLIALRYGSVPIVRSVGGLADTICDIADIRQAFHNRNGFCFEPYSAKELDETLHRAIHYYMDQPNSFLQLRQNGMRQDFSWKEPAQHYLNIYHHIKA